MPEILQPLGEQQLLVFLVQLLVLLGAARGLGALATRFGQPHIVGELGAGLLLGPSVFGSVAPEAARWIFPPEASQSNMLLAAAWLGILLLLVATGFETDLGLVVRLGRSSAAILTGSFLVPLGMGLALGALLPAAFVGGTTTRVAFIVFIAVAMSVSSVPVAAKILSDMRLMRRNVGQLILAAGTTNDVLSLILLGLAIGLTTEAGLDPLRMIVTLAGIVVFFVLAATGGQRLIDAALRRAGRARAAGRGTEALFAATMLVVLGIGALAQYVGVEAVLGAFVAGILLGRSRYLGGEVRRMVEVSSRAVFAPIFFATAGLRVDFGPLLDPASLLWALAIVLVAGISRVVGSYAGRLFGGMRTQEAVAVGFGLNARGALGLVIATVALALDVFNETSYTAVVLMALLMSMGAPPLIRWALSGIRPEPEEAERLEREELLSESVIANAKAALLPTAGGRNSMLAARLLDLTLMPEAPVTVLNVSRGDGDGADPTDRAASLFEERRVERRRAADHDVAHAILEEAGLGSDILAFGLNEDYSGSHRLSPVIREALTGTTVPLLLVRRAEGGTGDEEPFRSIVVPATGTRMSRAAEEIAYTLAARVGARVNVVHVITRPDKLPEPTYVGEAHPIPSVREVVSESVTLARRFGRDASAIVRTGTNPQEELVRVAEELRADAIFVGTQIRSAAPSLGHGTEFILEHARQTVVVLALPPETRTQGARPVGAATF